ncbi:MAG: hypothetical protein K6B70_07540 [Clostridia bacterium]|nr:hypothetical protein [Clostridia bacterium]
MGQKIEGYWDCAYCRTKAIRGGIRTCPNCGKARGEDTKFYLIEKDRFVSDDVVEKGPDWYCAYCDTLNPFSATHCINCNSAKTDATDDYFSLREKKLKQTSSNEEITEKQATNYDETEKSAEIETQVDENAERTKSYNYEEFDESDNNSLNDDDYEIQNKSKLSAFREKAGEGLDDVICFIVEHLRGIIVILAILAVIGTLIAIFRPREVKMDITDTSWTREIEIEEYKTVREDDWSIPEGGRLVETRREIYTYKQVLDHYETVTEQKSERYISGYRTVTEHVDLGNGYFDTRTHQEPVYDTRYYTVERQEPVYRSEPVYKTKYYYDIERWVYEKTATAGGSENPYWPDVTELKDNERTGKRTETYKITGVNKKKKEKTYKMSYDLWEQIHTGDRVDIIVSGKTVKEIKSIEKQG